MRFGIICIIFIAVCSLADRAIALNLLVHPDGSGEYGTIGGAIAAAVDGDTVMLTDGVYAGRGNTNLLFLGKKILLCSQSGNPDACIIDVAGEANEIAERGITFTNNEDSLSILKDITIIHGSADAPCPGCEGAGLYVNYSSPTIINVTCRDNYAADGAGIMIVGGSPKITNCRFVNNTAFEGAGFMCLDSAEATVSNCLISGNRSDLRGGGVSIQSYCNLTMINCTVSNNTSPTGGGIAAWESDYDISNSIISFNGGGASVFAYGASHIAVSHSDVFGNVGGDWVDSIGWQQGINGNIGANPLYADTSIDDFRLTQNSPCINTGDPNSPHDPDGTIADMGAYYFNQTGTIGDIAQLPMLEVRNYPNPFNAQTTIAYSLENGGPVRIEIYDLLGRQVQTLINEKQSAGYHQVVWDASDASSGLYFCRVSADARTEGRNMLLLK